jgi:hypothetical protein
MRSTRWASRDPFALSRTIGMTVREQQVSSVKHAWRFVFGCALGLGLGYAVTLLLSPGRDTRRPRPDGSPSSADIEPGAS